MLLPFLSRQHPVCLGVLPDPRLLEFIASIILADRRRRRIRRDPGIDPLGSRSERPRDKRFDGDRLVQGMRVESQMITLHQENRLKLQVADPIPPRTTLGLQTAVREISGEFQKGNSSVSGRCPERDFAGVIAHRSKMLSVVS